ncbi:MAG TPA: hypothetical protein VHD91_08190 [Gaiellaceae bacterium]|nr:hypothetical protein [Gaiellaceae bacterium]
MRTLIVGLVATAALATATAASACHGRGHQNGREHSVRHSIRLSIRHSARVNARFVAFKRGVEHGVRFGFFGGHVSWAKLSGTGSDFNGTNPSATGSIVAGNDHPNGHFTVGLNTTWSSAVTKSWTDDDGDADDGTVTVSCAPSTATLTLSNGSTNTYTLTGKACSVTRNGTTKYGFAGVSSDGVKAFLREKGTAVTGVVFTGATVENGVFAGCGH